MFFRKMKLTHMGPPDPLQRKLEPFIVFYLILSDLYLFYPKLHEKIQFLSKKYDGPSILRLVYIIIDINGKFSTSNLGIQNV
jgi:hypothetical protein